MVTYNVKQDRIFAGKSYVEGACLSTDTKPVAPAVKLENGSKLMEMDTATMYLYDEENNEWRPWE